MARMTPTVRCQGRSNCFDCTLRHEMVCSEVTLDELIDFHTGIEDFDYDHGAALFNMGAPTEGVYCIRHGAVKMVKQDSVGGQRIVRVLKKGDVVDAVTVVAHRFIGRLIRRLALKERDRCAVKISQVGFKDIAAHLALIHLFCIAVAAGAAPRGGRRCGPAAPRAGSGR